MTYLDFEKPVLEIENKIAELEALKASNPALNMPEIDALRTRAGEIRKYLYANITSWQRVQISRHPDRPYSLDYIDKMTQDFVELHGDRYFQDDKAIVGGFATIDGRSVMIIGQQKGRDTKSRQYRNFGMPNPEGYRKAYRLMKLAEKFGIPVVTLIDTPGAFPGLEAEARGQAEAIAKNLMMMATLRVPLVSIVIGEGASGGALGIGMGNEVFMMEYTWYSVISPESCSSILWKTWDYKEQAASALKLTGKNLLELGVIDGVIQEPEGGAHRDCPTAAAAVKKCILESLDRLGKLSAEQLVEQRVAKYGSMGKFTRG
jgi:acetyl-CoA carboxylase carboxyl transferase subunit alpha